jgi:hypothetical protein
VIAGAAALAAGATGAAVWVATDGDVPDGSLPPGRITVTP